MRRTASPSDDASINDNAPDEASLSSNSHGEPQDLPGAVELDFCEKRILEDSMRGCQGALDWMMLAILVGMLWRSWHLMTAALLLWYLHLLGTVWLNTLWRQMGPQRRYLRWREGMMCLLRTWDLGTGLAAALHVRVVQDMQLRTPLALALADGSPVPAMGSWLRLLYASAAVHLAFCSEVWRVRLSWSIMSQSLAAFTFQHEMRGMCSAGGELADAATRRGTRSLSRWLRVGLLAMPLPLAQAEGALDVFAAGSGGDEDDAGPAAECEVVLSWMLLWLGLALPLLLQATLACQQFRSHQQQRLVPETGWHAFGYGVLWEALHGRHSIPFWVVLYGTAAAVWDVCSWTWGAPAPLLLPAAAVLTAAAP